MIIEEFFYDYRRINYELFRTFIGRFGPVADPIRPRPAGNVAASPPIRRRSGRGRPDPFPAGIAVVGNFIAIRAMLFPNAWRLRREFVSTSSRVVAKLFANFET